MKNLWIVTLLFLCSCASKPVLKEATTASKRQELTVSTFNIRWYGLGGKKSGSQSDETRDSSLKKFMFEESKVSASDIIAFQEIVDPPRLQTLLPNHHCSTYVSKNPKHQHVVLCVLQKYDFAIEASDDNYTLESVKVEGRDLRPAVHGLLRLKEGKPLMHIIVVHLKAQEDESKMRLQQVEIIKNHIESQLTDGLPVLVLGDFNSHVKDGTHLEKDDAVLFEEIFQKGKTPLHQVSSPDKYTFRAKQSRAKLDHLWISLNIKVDGKPKTAGICNDETKTPEEAKQYYDNVSDHCPVSVGISIPMGE